MKVFKNRLRLWENNNVSKQMTNGYFSITPIKVIIGVVELGLSLVF